MKGTVTVNGAELTYVEEGSGSAVVFVHGDLSDHRTWDALAPRFSERFRAIAYSRRFHAPNLSIPDGADNQMAPHVEDLATLLLALDAAPAHLVGDSWGAFICLRMAIQSPELARSLVLAEPPVLPLLGTDLPPKLRQLGWLLITRPRDALAFLHFGARVAGPAAAMFRRGQFERGMQTFARGVLTPTVFDGFPEARREQARQNVAPLAAALTGKGFAPLQPADVAGVNLPVLLVAGAHTPPLFRCLTDRLEVLLPNCRRVTIPDASHSAHEQNAEAYAASVMAFLVEVNSATPLR